MPSVDDNGRRTGEALAFEGPLSTLTKLVSAYPSLTSTPSSSTLFVRTCIGAHRALGAIKSQGSIRTLGDGKHDAMICADDAGHVKRICTSVQMNESFFTACKNETSAQLISLNLPADSAEFYDR